MNRHFDDLEIRDAKARDRDLAVDLPDTLSRAKATPAMARMLRDVDPESVQTAADLARLPILTAQDLAEAQRRSPPFGGYATRRATEFAHIFRSDQGLYQPGRRLENWWRLGRFLFACDIGTGDAALNGYSYHLTAQGMMIESGMRAVDAAVVSGAETPPDLLAQIAADTGCTVYAGPLDGLTALLDAGPDLPIDRAVTLARGIDHDTRSRFADRGVTLRCAWATGDLGCIAYETEAHDGLVIEEGVLVEIVGDDGNPLPAGHPGRVVVTALNADYPLIRFATGDRAVQMTSPSPCGRTNMRLTDIRPA